MKNYDEKMSVLRMLEEGTISHIEAMELLEAVGDEQTEDRAMFDQSGNARKMLKIRVSEDEVLKVKVNIPLALAKAGLGIAKGVKDDEGREVLRGIDIDQLVELIESDCEGQLIEVDDVESGDHVSIYVE